MQTMIKVIHQTRRKKYIIIILFIILFDVLMRVQYF